MTAQIPDRIVIDGETMPLCTMPLGTYFALGGKQLALEPVSTALWRAYVATWEIRDERLYLVGIDATLRGGRFATLEDFFPGFPTRVFAHWYSGVLRVPQGALLRYVHAGFASRTESDLLIDIEDGVTVGRTTRVNGVAQEPASNGYTVAAMTSIRRYPERPER